MFGEPVGDDTSLTWCVILQRAAIRRRVPCGHKEMDVSAGSLRLAVLLKWSSIGTTGPPHRYTPTSQVHVDVLNIHRSSSVYLGWTKRLFKQLIPFYQLQPVWPVFQQITTIHWMFYFLILNSLGQILFVISLLRIWCQWHGYGLLNNLKALLQRSPLLLPRNVEQDLHIMWASLALINHRLTLCPYDYRGWSIYRWMYLHVGHTLV